MVGNMVGFESLGWSGGVLGCACWPVDGLKGSRAGGGIQRCVLVAYNFSFPCVCDGAIDPGWDISHRRYMGDLEQSAWAVE